MIIGVIKGDTRSVGYGSHDCLISIVQESHIWVAGKRMTLTHTYLP